VEPGGDSGVDKGAEEPDGSDGDSASDGEGGGGKWKGKQQASGLDVLFAAPQATAAEGDPVYALCRDDKVAFPKTINKEGKLRSAKYCGSGWPLHFRNPAKPMLEVQMVDLERVVLVLRDKHELVFHSVTKPSPGIVQVNFAAGKGGGTLQMYPGQFGRISGNCRLCIGDSCKMKAVRKILLTSQWFIDAVGHGLNEASNVYQPHGAVALPPLPSDAKPKDIASTIRLVYRRLGSVGKNALRQFIQESKCLQEGEMLQLVTEVFGDGGASAATKLKTKNAVAAKGKK